MNEKTPDFYFVCRSCEFTINPQPSWEEEEVIPNHCDRPMLFQPADPTYNARYLRLAMNIKKTMQTSIGGTVYYCEECGHTQDHVNAEEIPIHCQKAMTEFEPPT